MQQGLRFNPHGAVGMAFIALMFGIAFFLNWNVNWWYLVIAVLLYSGVVIFLVGQEEVTRKTFVGGTLAYESSFKTEDEKKLVLAYIFKYLLGCHLALLFLAVGLLVHFPNYTGLFGFRGGDNNIRPFYFLASVIGGLAIPLLLLKTSGGKNRIHFHGVIALLLIVLMFGIAFFYGWNLDWVYWLYFIVAIMLYIGACILLNPSPSVSRSPKNPPSPNPPSSIREQLGCHLAFGFLVVGFGLHFKDRSSIIGFFIVSIAIGLTIPYLLFRHS